MTFKFIKSKSPVFLKVPVLATGSDIKSGFSIGSGNSIYACRVGGDLKNMRNLENYRNALKTVRRKFDPRDCIIACDSHPGFISSQIAEGLSAAGKLPLFRIQHHHAHIASCMVDNNIYRGKVIGVAFDGTGYGDDGNVWGGEFMVSDLKESERAGHLEYIPMPGAEAAIIEPWRMAISLLYKAYGDKYPAYVTSFAKGIKKETKNIVIKMIKEGVNCPLTSSAGRLFDGVASLAGLGNVVVSEAQLAIELEKIADGDRDDYYKFNIIHQKDRGVFNVCVAGMVRGIVKDLKSGVDKSVISSRFHNGVCQIVKDSCIKIRKKRLINKVVLTGGVFQNRLLSKKIPLLLRKSSFEVYLHERLSASDADISQGQVMIAAHRSGICV